MSSLFARFYLFLLLMSVTVAKVCALPSGDEILILTDRFRLDPEPQLLQVSVKNYEDDSLANERLYEVYAKDSDKSLVLSKHPKETGQKFLMVDGNFWIFMPRSKRPIRITPRQRLLGNAALGDITSLAFAADYSGKIVQDGDLIEGKTTLQLELIAKTDAVIYDKINLWVDKKNYFPIKADYFFKSGRLAKNATFVAGPDREGNEIVSGIILYDKVRNNVRTEMTFLGVKSVDIPDRYYNPSFLVRANIEIAKGD